MGDRLDEEKFKELVREGAKQAHREFLDEAFATFGKWTLTALGAAIFSALVYFILAMQGWHPPKN